MKKKRKHSLQVEESAVNKRAGEQQFRVILYQRLAAFRRVAKRIAFGLSRFFVGGSDGGRGKKRRRGRGASGGAGPTDLGSAQVMAPAPRLHAGRALALHVRAR